ncbi:MAG: TetR/AcrR family transcriptional regulator, partial [Thermodesulfobacteriota bacterium]
MDEKTAKERILDTAEHLFAGEITTEAKAHLAAVNYHFGSNGGLVRAVLARRAGPLNQERLRMLESFELGAGNMPIPLELILHALFAPPIRVCLEHPNVMRPARRVLSGPDKGLRPVFLSQFEEVFLRLKTALRRALPELPERGLLWRMHFLAGVMIHTYTNHMVLESLSNGLCVLPNDREVVERLIHFCS